MNRMALHVMGTESPLIWVLELSLAGMFGSGFGRVSAKLGLKIPLDRRGWPGSLIFNKNIPPKPVLGPWHDEQKSRQISFRYPANPRDPICSSCSFLSRCERPCRPAAPVAGHAGEASPTFPQVQHMLESTSSGSGGGRKLPSNTKIAKLVWPSRPESSRNHTVVKLKVICWRRLEGWGRVGRVGVVALTPKNKTNHSSATNYRIPTLITSTQHNTAQHYHTTTHTQHTTAKHPAHQHHTPKTQATSLGHRTRGMFWEWLFHATGAPRALDGVATVVGISRQGCNTID